MKPATSSTWNSCTWLLSAGFFFLSATIQVTAALLTDQFGTATPVSGPAVLTASNASATAEPSEPSHAGEPARRSLWATLLVTNTGTYSLSTSNSLDGRSLWQDTVLAVYTGNSLTNLQLITSNDDVAPFTLWSRVFFRAHAGESIHVAVDLIGTNTGIVNLNIERGPVVPPWTALDLQGRPISSTNFDGRVVLIDFWETTCAGCVEELPHLSALHNEFKDRGFTMIGLAIDKQRQLIDAYLEQHPIPYLVGINAGSIPAVLDSSVGVPVKYLIDQEGRMVARYIGAFSPASDAYDFYASAFEYLNRPAPAKTVLTIAHAGNQLILSWPTRNPPHQLESATDPGSTIWNSIPQPATISEGNFTVTVPVPDDRQFFRLRRL